MDHDITPYVFHEAYLADHRTDGLRSGEGCVEVLKDGSLYIVYGRFDGSGDASPATLVERRSTDGGVTWTDPKVFIPTPADSQNLMSMSLLRLQDGRLAALYLHKHAENDCRPRFMTSDDADHWTEPKLIIDRPGYYVVNNDRLIQLAGGRILVPFAFHGVEWRKLHAPVCGCVISDDGGATWRLSAEINILKENVLTPKFMDTTDPKKIQHIVEGTVVCQEPGVIELSDGRVMMWCRSTGGYAYRAISTDGGETWGPYEAIPEFAMPCGPQSIKRLPGSNRLIMLYNDRGEVPLGAQQFNWRRPLDVAVSDDNATTWRRLGLLEPATVPTTCYYSIIFHNENAVFTYYEGVMRADKTGWFTPRNLASLKLKIVRQAYFAL